ncbi:MAG: hypothetical protein HC828_13170 [Blastochloris sp.]|nr:hypothetical protein [Blastochloris sp.]
MIKLLLQQLSREDYRALMEAFNGEFTYFVNLPDDHFVAVHIQDTSQYQLREVAGSFYYGRYAKGPTMVDQYIQKLNELNETCLRIMEAKNHDYRGGTGDPYANFRRSTILGIDPEIGIMLRMCDKHQRIRTFITRGMLKVKGESVLDAILDCHNYTCLAIGMRTTL